MTTETTLQTVLASEFDEYKIREQIRARDRNTVYEVTVDGSQAACKMTENQPGMLAREGAILTTLQEQTTVQVPDVLGMGHGFLLLEWIQGDTYDVDDPPEERRALLSTVGRTVAQVHNATQKWFQGHGALEPDDGPLTVDKPVDWPVRLKSFIEEWANEVEATQYRDVGRAVVETVSTYRDMFTDCMPVLVHGEVCPGHVFFDTKGAVTLIDWEISQAAPGGFDLVWAERDLLGRPVDGDELNAFRSALLEGYQEERSLNPGFWFRREVYRAAFSLRELSVVVNTDSPAECGKAERGRLLQNYIYNRLEAAESIGQRFDR
jgi:aminoglycoside phosphotransferase (APT) family kinase protein